MFFISQAYCLALLMSEWIRFRTADNVTHTKLTCLQIDNLNCPTAVILASSHSPSVSSCLHFLSFFLT